MKESENSKTHEKWLKREKEIQIIIKETAERLGVDDPLDFASLVFSVMGGGDLDDYYFREFGSC